MRRQLAPYGRQGGKSYSARKIIQYFPSKISRYIEPFLGAGSVFFALMEKTTPDEIILNDLDYRVINVISSLKETPEIVNTTIPRGLITEEEFENRKNMTDGISQLLVYRWSFGSKGVSYNAKKEPKKITTDFAPFGDKLQNAILTRVDFKEVIEKWDTEDAVLYLDPPYENTNPSFYNPLEPTLVASVLKNTKGHWFLSYNKSENILQLFKEYHIIELPVVYRPMRDIGTRVVTELLISNRPFV